MFHNILDETVHVSNWIAFILRFSSVIKHSKHFKAHILHSMTVHVNFKLIKLHFEIIQSGPVTISDFHNIIMFKRIHVNEIIAMFMENLRKNGLQ